MSLVAINPVVPAEIGDLATTITKEDEVESIPPTVTEMKHPLNSEWTLWYFIQDGNKNWELCQMKIASYSTVEDFWALFNHVSMASNLKAGCDYSLFKNGIKPMWEDSANVNGGRWSINLTKQQRFSEMDSLWLEVAMMMIGENEEEAVNKDICGAVVNNRPRGDRLAIWTASSTNPTLTMKVGRCMRKNLTMSPSQPIEFKLHSDTSSKRSGAVRSLYTV